MDKFEDAFLKETLELLFARFEKLSRAAVFCLNNLTEKYLRGGREEYLIKFGYSIARKVVCVFYRRGLLEKLRREILLI